MLGRQYKPFGFTYICVFIYMCVCFLKYMAFSLKTKIVKTKRNINGKRKNCVCCRGTVSQDTYCVNSSREPTTLSYKHVGKWNMW